MRVGLMLAVCALVGGVAVAQPLVLNAKTIPAWDLPAENWQFYPLEWQTQPLADGVFDDGEVSATVTVGPHLAVDPPFDTAHHARDMAMEQFRFQGGLVLRAAGTRQYRLQLSASDHTIALWKTPENFLAAVDFPLAVGQPVRLTVRLSGAQITVLADGKPIIDVTDRFDPILRGQVLAGANHARMTFDAVSVIPPPPPGLSGGASSVRSLPPSAAVAMPAVAHFPAFAVRRWCGARWVFDGHEPVARIGEGKNGKLWDGFPTGLFSTKLRPGTRAAEVIPLCYNALGYWPESPVAVKTDTPGRVVLEALTTDRAPGHAPTGATSFQMTITYDAVRDSYVYDVDSTVTYLAARKPIAEVLDPWPYGVVGPAYPQAPQWDQRYQILLWRGEDGRFYRQPFNHYAIFGGLLSATQPEIVITGESDVVPHYELYGDSLKYRYNTGLCTVMFDLHVQPTRNAVVPAGTVEHFQWRESTLGAADGVRLLAESVWSVSAAARGKLCARYFPAGNSFDPAQMILLDEPSSAQLFSPPEYYTIDPTVGHDAPGSLRMDAADGSRPVTVRDGASTFGRLFDGRELELSAWVRSEALDGAFTVSMESYPKPEKVTSAAITGTAGWQHISLRVRPQQSQYFVTISLTMDAKRGAKGVVWIDDLTLLPVDAGK